MRPQICLSINRDRYTSNRKLEQLKLTSKGMAPAITAEDVAHNATMRRVTWRLLPFLILIYIIAWLDRVNVGFAALQMNRDLDFSPAVYGFGAGIFFLGYAAFEVPSNLVLTRVGARRWIARIMVSWGLISTAMLFVRGPVSFYSMRFLLGAAEAGCYPGLLYYLSIWYPMDERGKALGVFAAAIPLASILGGPLAGALLSLDGYLHLTGWQWLFVVEGMAAVLLGVIVLRYLPDSPSSASWLDPIERAALTERLVRERASLGSARAETVRKALLNRTIWISGLSFALGTTASYGLQFWIPQILKTLSHGSDLTVGFLSAIPYLATPFAMVIIGARSDRARERCLHAAIPCFISSLGFVVAAYARSPVVAILALTISTAGIYGRIGPCFSIPTLLFDGPAAAAAIALINTIGSVGGFVGPYAVGLAKSITGNYIGALLFLGVAAALCGLLLVTIRRDPAIQRWTHGNDHDASLKDQHKSARHAHR